MPGNFAPFEAKMRADGLSDAAVAAFKNAYDALTSGSLQRCISIEAPSDSGRRHHWSEITGPGGTASRERCRRDAQSNATAARRTRRAPPTRA